MNAKNDFISLSFGNIYKNDFLFGFKDINVKKQIRIFMENQPNGYKDFYHYAGKSNRQGEMRLATSISEGQRALQGNEPLRLLFNGYPRDISFWNVPLYIVPTITTPAYAIRFVESSTL